LRSHDRPRRRWRLRAGARRASARAPWLAAATLLSALLAACGSLAPGRSAAHASGHAVAAALSAPTPSRHACGPAAAEVLADTAGAAARQIYASELSSTEVRADERQVETYAPLLSALARHDRAGVAKAVTSLVFSHTHMVRLRVTQAGRVVADVGGPYVIAPVGGSLRFHGRSVGEYVLSVQDDLGYVKLETRYVGVPLVLHMGARRLPLEGTLAPGPASPPRLGHVSVGGASYESFSFSAKAFPSAHLRISLLVPLARLQPGMSCVAIRHAELERIAQRTWRRFSLVGASPSDYVRLVANLTGGRSYVRSGSRQLAGSDHGPTRLPRRGSVRYRGARYSVTSFAARVGGKSALVYLLLR
jgi:hypothetical protein